MTVLQRWCMRLRAVTKAEAVAVIKYAMAPSSPPSCRTASSQETFSIMCAAILGAGMNGATELRHAAPHRILLESEDATFPHPGSGTARDARCSSSPRSVASPNSTPQWTASPKRRERSGLIPPGSLIERSLVGVCGPVVLVAMTRLLQSRDRSVRLPTGPMSRGDPVYT